MSTSWYYVRGTERVGPVSEEEIAQLAGEGQIGPETYVWRKGIQNWERLKNMEELQSILAAPEVEEDIEEDGPPTLEPSASGPGPNWNSIDPDQSIFTLKIGKDRGGAETEYGPYSLEKLKALFRENRINGKTLVFAPGMTTWRFLAESPIYNQVTNDGPPIIEDTERRTAERRPFVARMLFHDNSRVYEGVCRDISVGGLQILVADFPGRVGDKISLNVHPDNGQLCFTASGKVVRLLEGGTGLSLRFMELTPEARLAIDSYIQSVE